MNTVEPLQQESQRDIENILVIEVSILALKILQTKIRAFKVF